MKKTKNRKWLWIIIAALVLLLIGYIGVKWWNRDVVSIKTATVVTGPIEAIVSVSGVVDAPVYELGTKMGGKIGSWKVSEGNHVYKGQLLAEFDNYEQARNDYERTQQLYNDGFASKQALDAAKTMLDASRIIAPNTGVVAKISFREGETVVPGQPAIMVVNYDQSWIEAQIDEIDIADVRIGDKVKITCDVYPDKTFEGQIYWIAPIAELRKVGGRVKMDEESYVFLCKIKFLGEHKDLKANMSVNVEIVTKKNPAALMVPREALISRDDSSLVFKIKKSRGIASTVHEQKIEVGIRSFSSVEAISGIAEGDMVAISNVSKLKDKGRVRVER